LHDAVFDVPDVLKLLTIDFIAMIVGDEITGFKFVCSSCYENLYKAKRRRRFS